VTAAACPPPPPRGKAVEAVLLLPCTRHEVYCKPFIGPSTQRAQASLHCWPAGWAVASDESIATHNFSLYKPPCPLSQPPPHPLLCSFASSLHTHAPRNIINHHDRRRSSCASTTEILLIDHWCRSGGSDTRASSTLSPHSATVTLATAVATFGARLRQTRRDF
jgi:hypothetical protein